MRFNVSRCTLTGQLLPRSLPPSSLMPTDSSAASYTGHCSRGVEEKGSAIKGKHTGVKPKLLRHTSSALLYYLCPPSSPTQNILIASRFSPLHLTRSAAHRSPLALSKILYLSQSLVLQHTLFFLCIPSSAGVRPLFIPRPPPLQAQPSFTFIIAPTIPRASLLNCTLCPLFPLNSWEY